MFTVSNSTDTSATILSADLNAICRTYRVQELALFGSVLTEHFQPDSDIDFLVEFEPAAKISFLTLSQMQNDLAKLLHRPVDLVPKNGLKPLIRDSVLASAKVIYAR